MTQDLRAVTAIAVLLALILLALLLKRLGLLEEAHGKVISRLVTHVTLPAIVLVSTVISLRNLAYVDRYDNN